jgi:hypothetical protein
MLSGGKTIPENGVKKGQSGKINQKNERNKTRRSQI